jgi:orotate phosphoribosyltransferase
MKNLQMFSQSQEYLDMLSSFGIIEKGHFEYKGKAPDGTRLRGEYFINFRKLKTSQELALVPLYWKAIEEFFSDKMSDLIIVGVAMGSLSLPKVIQSQGFEKYGIEYAYTEKRNGILGLFGEQAEKCKGKHLLFIEDVCNNGTSSRELAQELSDKKSEINFSGFSILYGVHRGHTFLENPPGEIYAMGKVFAPAYHADDLPEETKKLPLKEYKK